MQWIENRNLSELTTMGIGGPARLSVDVHTIEEMQEAIVFAHEKGIPFFILGKGSNCIFDDKGLNALLIVNKIDFIQENEGEFHVGSGYSFSRLGSLTARNGWSGLEFASGIPGSVGGAVYMNAGANGNETRESLTSVDFIDSEGDLVHYPRSALTFSYRHSSFHEMKGAIVGATFLLKKDELARKKQITIINYRTATQPYSDKSAGCIFRNPESNHAGALIEKAGLKGLSIGGAEVSPMHANFIVNKNQATAKEVLELIEAIRVRVKEKLGIDLQNEVRYIPYDWNPL